MAARRSLSSTQPLELAAQVPYRTYSVMIGYYAMINQELVYALLREIDSQSKAGVMPVTSDILEPLSRDADVLEHLVAMKKGNVISGDLIKELISGTPRRMTNIRLTYAGLRMLRDGPEKAVLLTAAPDRLIPVAESQD